MYIYKHTQIGTLILCSVGVGVAIAAIISVLFRPAVGVLLVLVTFMILFSSLTVEVTEDQLLASFGPGLIRKRFPIEEIRSARIVRNPWFYGWGIRLTPHGWLFNVSGFGAVEIDMKDNRKFRIGTDEPDRLLAAIARVSQLAG